MQLLAHCLVLSSTYLRYSLVLAAVVSQFKKSFDDGMIPALRDQKQNTMSDIRVNNGLQ